MTNRDRTLQFNSWADYLRPIKHRGVTIYADADNHYAGFGPATVDLLKRLWDARR